VDRKVVHHRSMYIRRYSLYEFIDHFPFLQAPFPRIIPATNQAAMNELYKSGTKNADNLEHADVVVDPLLLVLSYTLGNPSDVADFLFP